MNKKLTKTVETNRYLRKEDSTWDYKGEDTKTYTHGLHTYPAMFIPQVAKRLIELHSNKGDTICDIFCGSGTALVESRLLGRNCYGIDLNPLATFLAKVKTTPINPHLLDKAYLYIIELYSSSKEKNIMTPNFKNINFWFKSAVITQLARLKKAISNIENNDIRDFYMVLFSETVRLCSNTRSSEFKLYRYDISKLESHNPDVLVVFKKKVEAGIKGMTQFCNDLDRKTWAKAIYGDSSEDNGIPEGSIDCIVTSPPYGDSRTTVAYGQFSRLSLQWLDIHKEPEQIIQIDNMLLGGKTVKDMNNKLESEHLDKAIKEIMLRDKKRAREVLTFYIDLEKCIKRAFKILKQKGYFCLVIGNRLVKQVRIPTDYIIAELGENNGFVCERIIQRNIPGKRMPKRTSPTNKKGVSEETMNRESIVILKKD